MGSTNLTDQNAVRTTRDKRAQVITYLTAAEASIAGLDKYIRRYDVNQFGHYCHKNDKPSWMPLATGTGLMGYYYTNMGLQGAAGHQSRYNQIPAFSSTGIIVRRSLVILASMDRPKNVATPIFPKRNSRFAGSAASRRPFQAASDWVSMPTMGCVFGSTIHWRSTTGEITAIASRGIPVTSIWLPGNYTISASEYFQDLNWTACQFACAPSRS